MSGGRVIPPVAIALAVTLGTTLACEPLDLQVFDILDASDESDVAAPDVAVIRQTNKIDMLLVVDNSASMAENQRVLADTIPDFVRRLANPPCVDDAGLIAVQEPDTWSSSCPAGSHRQFPPVVDLHIGVITTSLGSYGATSCGPLANPPTTEEMSHLLHRDPNNPEGALPTWNDKGFLFWDPQATANPPGDNSLSSLSDTLSQIVLGAGQQGCGFESTLESWYRFLVDPAPYQAMVVTDGFSHPALDAQGKPIVDQVILTQRRDFLRPDSLVVILMLSDDDDCSVTDYRILVDERMRRGTTICNTSPGSPYCRTCGAGVSDPQCFLPQYTQDEDPLVMRCYRQKQRFGTDYLQPISRYAAALSDSQLEDGRINPLFCSNPSDNGLSCTTPLREISWVVVGAIVGVPWQDLAVDPNDPSKGYRASSELQWFDIAGSPERFLEPSDPFMVPAIEPRSGVSPISGQTIAPPEAPVAWQNPVNGHEWKPSANSDMQYACIFDLPAPRPCDSEPCDCINAEWTLNPICQNPVTNAYEPVMYRGKAYPSVRILSVLQKLGDRGVPASICAPNLLDPSRPDYGYRSAADSLVRSMQPYLK